MHTEYIDYADGKNPLEGYLAYDTTIKGKRPAVIVSHAWGGQDDFARSKAEALAKLGYAGFALDLYGKGKRGNNQQENAALMQPFIDDRTLLLRRMNAAVQTISKYLIVDPNCIGAIGFCFGGLCVLDLARSGPEATGVKGVVSFHGLLASSNQTATKITAKVLVLHGYNDPWAKPEDVTAFADEMTQAKTDWQIHMYGNTVHAFTNPQMNSPATGAVYNECADKRSWIAMKDFLEELLG